MPLSKRGRRRALLLGGALIVIVAGAVVVRGTLVIQQRRAADSARSQGMAAFDSGNYRIAGVKLKEYCESTGGDVEAACAWAESCARVPAPGGRQLVEAIDIYAKRCLPLIDAQARTPDILDRKRRVLERLLELYGPLGLRLELVQTADRLLAIDPDNVDAMAAKGEVLLIDRKFDEAMPLAARLMTLQPENLSWRRLQLELLQGKGGSPEQQVEQCRQWAAEPHSDGRFHLLAATVLAEMSRAEEARQEMELAVKGGAMEREILERSLSLLDLLDRPDRSAELFMATKAKFPHEQWVREVGVRRLLRGDRIKEAIAEIGALESEFGADIGMPLRKLKAMVLVLAGRVDDARRALAPMLAGPMSGRDEEAGRAWAAAVDAATDSSEPDFVSILDRLQAAVVMQPNDAWLHYLIGRTSLRAGERNGAIRSFGHAHELDPDWVAAGTAYVSVLEASGRIDDAYRNARMVYSRAPKDLLAPFVLLARAYLDSRDAGQMEPDPQTERELIDLLAAARRDAPADPDVSSLLCSLLWVAGESEEAMKSLREATDPPQTSADMLIAMAEVSRRRGMGVEDGLLARAAAEPGAAATLVRCRRLIASGKPNEALELLDQAIAASKPQGDERRRLQGARISCLAQAHPGEVGPALDAMLEESAASPLALEFIMAQPQAWEDPVRAAQIVKAVRQALGEQSPPARLAEATFLLRHHAQEEPQLANAIVLINGVLEQHPESRAALSLLADALTIGSHPNLSRAVECMESAASLYPGEASIRLRLIGLLQLKGDYAAAARHLAALSRLSDGDPSARRQELRLLVDQGDLDSGLARAAAIVTPQSPIADRLLLAQMSRRAGRLEEAERLYRQLLAESPADPLVLSQAADFYADTGRLEQGAELLESASIPGGDAARLAQVGGFQRRHGMLDAAAASLKRAMEADPESVQAIEESARLALDQGDRRRSAELVRQGLAVEPSNERLQSILAAASVALTSQERRDAIDLIRRSGPASDDLLATMSLLDEVRIDGGRLRPTAANLADAKHLIESRSRYLPAWQLAVALYVDAGQHAEAASIARRAAARFPGEPSTSRLATRLLMQTSQWKDALIEAREWRRRSLDDVEPADEAIAAILLQLSRGKDAVAALQPHQAALLASRETDPDAYMLWVHALAAGGRMSEARELAWPLLKADASWRRRWAGIAQALPDDASYEALTALEEAAADPSEFLMLSSQWTMLGRRSGKAECFDRAEDAAFRIGRDPQWMGKITTVQGAIAEARGERSSAEALYRRAIELEPDNAVALNNLASLLAPSPSGAAEALPMIEKALSLQPDSPEFLDTYAAVLLGLDRVDDAERALAAALAARPDDPGMRLNWAEVQIRRDRRGEAERALSTAQAQLAASPRPDPALAAKAASIRKRLLESQAAARP